MAVGNPTLQRALAERRAALGMSQPDPEAGTLLKEVGYSGRFGELHSNGGLYLLHSHHYHNPHSSSASSLLRSETGYNTKLLTLPWEELYR
ncbi:hypothetical protein YC2023_007255 [Brassica napus]